jgi:hypothetical protein
MARVARNYHENLQNEGINYNLSQDEHENKTRTFLKHIPKEQTIPEECATPMNWPVREEQVKEAICMSKNGSATGMDGCLSPPGQRLPEWRVWSNELREEMHQRRRDRRRPPGQVDKLPSSWSVTLNAASFV